MYIEGKCVHYYFCDHWKSSVKYFIQSYQYILITKEQEFQDCKLGYYIEIPVDTREKYLLSGNLIFLQHNLQKLL